MDSELQEFIDRFESAKNTSEKEQVASEYIDYKFSKDGNLDSIKDILVKLCVELDELDTNPFIIFTTNYQELNLDFPNRKCLTTLNNLFARGIIDEHNLDGTDEDGSITKTILYNHRAYNNEVDSEFVITSYYWLSVKSNLNGKINYMALAKSQEIQERFQDSIYQMAIAATDRSMAVRNVIIYAISYEEARGDGATVGYDIRPKRDIETILRIAASRQSYNGQQTNYAKEDNISNIVSMVARMSDVEKVELFQALGIKTQ